MGQGLEPRVPMELFLVYFKQLLENQPLTVVGDGKQKRDFLYVTDVANAFIKQQ